jgi:WD40 repeat protein
MGPCGCGKFLRVQLCKYSQGTRLHLLLDLSPLQGRTLLPALKMAVLLVGLRKLAACHGSFRPQVLLISNSFVLRLDARFDAGALTSLAINPNSTVVAVGGTEGLIKLVNLQNGSILASLGAQTGDSIESLAWASTLPLLVAGSTDSKIYLYDTQSYRLRRTLSHEDAVTAIVLPKDSFELTSASVDKSVRRWDIRTGQELARRTGHQDAIVGGLALSKDGKIVITGGDDNVALVWKFD